MGATMMMSPPTEIPSNIKSRTPSPSGNKIAILLEEGGGDASSSSNKKQIIEIWSNQGQSLQKRIVLPPTLHGKVCANMNEYGSIQWNKQETALVYCAERQPVKSTSFFDTNSEEKGEGRKVVKGGQYTLGIGIDVTTGNVGLIDNVPSSNDDGTTQGGYLLGQPVFTPDGDAVVYTAWDAGSGGSMPKRLGSTYCQQRFGKIYVSSVKLVMQELSSSAKGETKYGGKDEGYECLTQNDVLARSPRFFYSGGNDSASKLAFLSNPR
eukprot:7214101-Ditylum_brightwellii.AAC.1